MYVHEQCAHERQQRKTNDSSSKWIVQIYRVVDKKSQSILVRLAENGHL